MTIATGFVKFMYFGMLTLHVLYMRILPFIMLLLAAGCADNSHSAKLVAKQPFSKGQNYLIRLQDSLRLTYRSKKSDSEKLALLENVHEQLEIFLMHHRIDSIQVKIDTVIVDGVKVTTKSHFGHIQFQYGLKFSGDLSPRVDSIYEFSKGLRPGSDTLANFSYTGACQVNSPDSPYLPTFRIYAFPSPLQY